MRSCFDSGVKLDKLKIIFCITCATKRKCEIWIIKILNLQLTARSTYYIQFNLRYVHIWVCSLTELKFYWVRTIKLCKLKLSNVELDITHVEWYSQCWYRPLSIMMHQQQHQRQERMQAGDRVEMNGLWCHCHRRHVTGLGRLGMRKWASLCACASPLRAGNRALSDICLSDEWCGGERCCCCFVLFPRLSPASLIPRLTGMEGGWTGWRLMRRQRDACWRCSWTMRMLWSVMREEGRDWLAATNTPSSLV